MNRNIFFTLIGTMAVMTIAWVWYSFGIAGKRLEEINGEVEALNEQFAELAMVADSYDQFKTSFDEQVEAFAALQETIPSNQEYAGTLEQIRDAAQELKLQIIALSPMLADAYPALHTGYKRVKTHVECYPVELKIYGDYLSIGQFVEEVEGMGDIVNIARLTLETEMEAGGTLSCDMLLFTYIFVEEG